MRLLLAAGSFRLDDADEPVIWFRYSILFISLRVGTV
jgi:hypothetical protein